MLRAAKTRQKIKRMQTETNLKEVDIFKWQKHAPPNRQKVADSNQLLRSRSKHNALFMLPNVTNEIIHLLEKELVMERFRDCARSILSRLGFEKFPEARICSNDCY